MVGAFKQLYFVKQKRFVMTSLSRVARLFNDRHVRIVLLTPMITTHTHEFIIDRAIFGTFPLQGGKVRIGPNMHTSSRPAYPIVIWVVIEEVTRFRITIEPKDTQIEYRHQRLQRHNLFLFHSNRYGHVFVSRK